MSKYGFNENEIVKTIVTKIDKDGFHKKEVFEGNVDGGGGSSDITYATMTVASGGNAVRLSVPTLEDDTDSAKIDTSEREYAPGEVVTVLLYKGQARASLYPNMRDNYAFSGDVEYDAPYNIITIHGDFTVTNSRQ